MLDAHLRPRPLLRCTQQLLSCMLACCMRACKLLEPHRSANVRAERSPVRMLAALLVHRPSGLQLRAQVACAAAGGAQTTCLCRGVQAVDGKA